MSIHDQGMDGNVLKKEMPNGAEMAIYKLVVGDQTMSVKELWVCCRRMLIREKDNMVMVDMSQCENLPVMVPVGDGQERRGKRLWML